MSMRKVTLVAVLILLALSSFPALAQPQEDLSRGRLFGIGAEVTAPIRSPTDPAWPNMFPATGLSTRLWLADLFGLDVNFWVFPGFPSFAFRTLFKFFNTPIVDIYSGLGMAVFYNGATPFQLIERPGGLDLPELGARLRGGGLRLRGDDRGGERRPRGPFLLLTPRGY
jgi:hypothetical protein